MYICCEPLWVSLEEPWWKCMSLSLQPPFIRNQNPTESLIKTAVLIVPWKSVLPFSVLYLNWLLHHKNPHFSHLVAEQIAVEGLCPSRVDIRPICPPLWQTQHSTKRWLLISKHSFLSLADSFSSWLWTKQRQQFSSLQEMPAWAGDVLSLYPHQPPKQRKQNAAWLTGHFCTDSGNIQLAALSFQNNSVGVNLVQRPLSHVYVCKNNQWLQGASKNSDFSL